MAWIELHQEFRDHTKIKRLATLLDCKRSEARSMIISLWLWAIGEARNGDVSKFTNWEIAEAVHAEEVWTLDNVAVRKIKEGLVEAHILDQKGEKILLHDWKKHGLRMLEQARRRTAKCRKDNTLGQRTVTLPLRNGNALLSSFLSNLSLSPTSTLRDDRFLKSWNEWVQHCREKRKVLTNSQAIKQLQWLSVQSDPIGCIEQSIRNGWQGLFELKDTPQAIVKRKRFITCKYCDQQVPEDEYYGLHLAEGGCSKCKPAPPEVVQGFVQQIKGLNGQMQIKPEKGERKR